MIDLDSSVRVISAYPEVCEFFSLPPNQHFQLETETVFFAGDFVIIEHDGHSLLALVFSDYYRTRIGNLSRDACAVVARAVPIISDGEH